MADHRITRRNTLTIVGYLQALDPTIDGAHDATLDLWHHGLNRTPPGQPPYTAAEIRAAIITYYDNPPTSATGYRHPATPAAIRRIIHQARERTQQRRNALEATRRRELEPPHNPTPRRVNWRELLHNLQNNTP